MKNVAVLLIAYFFNCGLCTGYAQTVPTVNYQADGQPTTGSYMSLNGTLPDLTRFTFCTHLKVDHVRGDSMALISYAVSDFPDELLIMYDVLENTVSFGCCQGTGKFVSKSPLKEVLMITWLHLCVAVDLINDRYMVVMNGKKEEGPIRSLLGEKLVIRGGGLLIVGQEQDIFGGGFSITQSFDGRLAGYALINGFLPLVRLMEFQACRESFEEIATVSFRLETWEVYGTTEKSETNPLSICTTDNSFYYVFPEQYTRKEAANICLKVKGSVVAPKSNDENDRVVSIVKQFVDECSKTNSFFMWVGITAKLFHDKFVIQRNVDDEVIRYSNFRTGFNFPFGNTRCVVMDKVQVSKWTFSSCHTKTCVTCKVGEPTRVRLRGLCQESLIDKNYIVNGYINGKIYLEGFKHTRIFFDNYKWQLTDFLYPSIDAHMLSTTGDRYPIGLTTWNLKGDNCPNVTSSLRMTACNYLQWTCQDGTCIRKQLRCDKKIDCPDQSDEIQCSAIVVPESYIKKVPPPKIGNKSAVVSLDLKILSMEPVDLVNLKIELVVVVRMKWNDPRIYMESLNYEEADNEIHNGDELWRPEFVFEDETNSEAKEDGQFELFTALRESGPLPDDINRAKEDEIYPGVSNSLRLRKTSKIRFTCLLFLQAYPFDMQKCSFSLKLRGTTKDFVRFSMIEDGVEYLGPKNLKEYTVLSTVMNESLRTNYSTFKVTILLDNLYAFYLSTAYVPTLIMVIICYTPFYYDIDDFQNRVMVSLTALLVLATLFAQMTQSTPKSAFLKLLDVWYVSCMLINFSTVCILVVINYVRLRDRGIVGSTTTPVLSYKNNQMVKGIKQNGVKLNYYARIFVPIIIGFFFMVYIIVAATIINI